MVPDFIADSIDELDQSTAELSPDELRAVADSLDELAVSLRAEADQREKPKGE